METTETENTVELLEKEFLQEQVEFHLKELKECYRHLGVLYQMLKNNRDLFIEDEVKAVIDFHSRIRNSIREYEDEMRQQAMDELINEVVCEMSTEQIVQCTKEAKSNGKLKLSA